MYVILKYQNKLKDLNLCRDIKNLKFMLNDLNILDVKEKIFELEFMLGFRDDEISFIKKKIEWYLSQEEKDSVQEFYCGNIILFLEQYTELIKKLIDNYSFGEDDTGKMGDGGSGGYDTYNFHSFGGL